jgi:rare lipoprotein A
MAVASWYGPGFYGHTTACGQTLQPTTFGVAHKALACGTKVRLCVKRCVTAPVIDRGPYVGGRTFDLTAPVKNAIGAGSISTVRFTVVG